MRLGNFQKSSLTIIITNITEQVIYLSNIFQQYLAGQHLTILCHRVTFLRLLINFPTYDKTWSLVIAPYKMVFYSLLLQVVSSIHYLKWVQTNLLFYSLFKVNANFTWIAALSFVQYTNKYNNKNRLHDVYAHVDIPSGKIK